MMVATLEFEVPVAISSPPSTKYLSTPGNLADDRSRSCATAASVRSVEAPSGSRTETKNAPWSSSGRKPAGRRLNRADRCTKLNASSASSASAERRIRNPTPVR